MSQNESQAIESITDEQILAIVHASFGNQAELLACQRMHGGHYNTLYEIITQNPDYHAILRVAPRDERPQGRFKRSSMLAEPIKYELIRRAGVPTAEVYAVDGSKTIIDRDYIVVRYIEGVSLDDKSVPAAAQHHIRQEAGRYTAVMHGISAEKFGWLQADGSINGSESWAEVLGEIMTETYTLAREAGVIDASHVEAVLDCFGRHHTVFDECRVPGFVHNDIWDPNILVNERDGRWQIEAIIDVDGGLFADPEYEFILWDSSDADFLGGYAKPLDSSPNAVLKRKFYRMHLYMQYAWFYLVMQPSPGFQPKALKISMELFSELCCGI